MYEYHWLPGTLAQGNLLTKFAKLYSEHYGTWGEAGPNPGKPVRLSDDRLREWLVQDSLLVWATAFGELIGYAVAAQSRLSSRGMVSWVTQLVVHKDHRKQDVGKTLLFTIWRFTDHFAWGIVSANPFAVRALEKATRRRCHPIRIAKDAQPLIQLGTKVAPYLSESTEFHVNTTGSRVNTQFFLDHSQLQAMLSASIDGDKPWLLGQLPEGWEWFAFTFQEQEQISLTKRELEDMLTVSDKLTKYAYSRMDIEEGAHAWAKHQAAEVSFILDNCRLEPGNAVLDFGCGQGRHTLGLAEKGVRATGVDYLESAIAVARHRAEHRSLDNAQFVVDDCRTVSLGTTFDGAICVYDVVGTYADEQNNLAILKNLANHVKSGGFILLSVMNLELTERNARNWFSLASEPDKLLALKASTTMETTGDIFNPDFYMIDRETKIVYRKEQFKRGEGLPEELLVRDRRYTDDQIRALCAGSGLEVIWSRFVRSGKWSEPLSRESDKAKEILILCKKRVSDNPQQSLFQ